MMTKRIATGAVLCSLLVPATEAFADGKDFALGIVTGVVGSAVVRNYNQQHRATGNQRGNYVYQNSGRQQTVHRSGMSSAQRDENRQVQVALNYFDFPVGTPDGALGPRSQGAIGNYQAFMGYPATGALRTIERDFLVNSYYRAQAGGPATQQQIASDPQGVRGLLTTWRDAQAGGVAPAAPAAAAPAAAGSLPSFRVEGQTAASLSAFCTDVGARSRQQGGLSKVSALNDPNFALSEQFCLARGAAISESDAMMTKVGGYTPAQIADQCREFGPVMAEYVADLSRRPEAQVLDRVASWAKASGLPADQLAGTAKVCLGSGYASDDLGVAIGSALVLTALGETGYAELPGHHLSQGFGADRRPDLARDWYETALSAPDQVFAVGGPDRMSVIRKAADAVSGRADALPDAGSSGALPTFGSGVSDAVTPVIANVLGAGVDDWQGNVQKRPINATP